MEDDKIEFHASPSRGVTYRGSKWGIVAACILLILSVVVFAFFSKFTLSAPAATPAQTAAAPVVTVTILFTNMQRGIETPLYNVQPYPGNEVVSGLVGRYYYIDLKDADSRESLFFEPEKYTKDEFESDFRLSMSAFRKDVLRVITQGGVSYRIFVRGSADITGNTAPYLADLIEGNERQIMYLPMARENPNQYLQQPVAQIVPRKYANVHLPNLRAAYVQEKLRALDLEATIIEGGVTHNISDKDRNAMMLLYVNWPKNMRSAQPVEVRWQ